MVGNSRNLRRNDTGDSHESHSRIIVKYESMRDILRTKGREQTAEITYNERDIPRFPTFRRLRRSSWQAVCARLICRCARRRRQPRLLFPYVSVSSDLHMCTHTQHFHQLHRSRILGEIVSRRRTTLSTIFYH